MYTLQLKNNQILKTFCYEILAIPQYTFLNESFEKAQECSGKLFSNILTENTRYSIWGSTVFEIMWSSQKDNTVNNKGNLHLYFIVRMISSNIIDLNNRIMSVKKNIELQLQEGGFQISECNIADLQRLSGFATGKYINGIVKTEECVLHSQMITPYYYINSMKRQKLDDFSAIGRTLIDMPGSVVSFQMMPDCYNSKESMGITEMYSWLNQIATGSINMQNGFRYQDGMVQHAKNAFQYLYDNINEPHFRYNILVSGEKQQCAIICGRLNSILTTTGNYTTLNLNLENVSIKKDLAYYPWNLNSSLIKKYRNLNLWNVLKNIPIMGSFIRLPYMITAEEAITLFRLPLGNKTFPGMKCMDVVQREDDIDICATKESDVLFGQAISNSSRPINIGCSLKELTKHMLIVGMPGTGKTTFSLNLLLQMEKQKIPFLAIEPTKTEYRALIEKIPDLQIFTPGNSKVSPFVINPFIPPEGITVEKYIPSLSSAFKATFSMPSPLDSAFQQAIQETYVKYGWKNYSTAQDMNVSLFGLHEFILVFKDVIKRQNYSKEIKGNLQSAGVLRLRNLIEQNANIYDTTQSVPIEDLLAKSTVLELNAIDNEEQKKVLMALILINVCAYTKHNHTSIGALKNVLLIDEAHVLFNKLNSEDLTRDKNSTVKSLENMLAEIRSYGTGIVIADQSPGTLGDQVVKMTDIKITFRIVDAHDKKIIASSISMDEKLEEIISKLNTGQAFINYEALNAPILVKTPDIREKENIRLDVSDAEVYSKAKYWKNHQQYLIPFSECRYSTVCSNCDFKLRSDAEFYAVKFCQMFGDKILDIKLLCSYLKAVDDWLIRETGTENIKINNCTKIRILRKMMQKDNIIATLKDYEKILSKMIK